MSLKFDISWLPAPGVKDPGEAATWAEISVRLGDAPVSRLLDERVNAVRSGFFSSVLPFAEWLADVWPRLVHERRAPVVLGNALGADRETSSIDTRPERTEYFEWVGYHALRAGRHGGAMPNVRVLRFDDSFFAVRSNADTSLAPGMSARFIVDAEARVPAAELKSELHRVIEAVVTRLGPLRNSRVERFLQRWCDALSEFATVAGRLGVDDESLTAQEREAVASLVERPDREVILGVAEGSGAASLNERLAQAESIAQELPESAPESNEWRTLEEALTRVRLQRPWLTGWNAASEFRKAIGLRSDEAPGTSLPGLLEERCGWPSQMQVFGLDRPPTAVDTVHIRQSAHMPAVLTSNTRPQSRRFRLARTLYHFLFADVGAGTRSVADSPLVSGRLSEANAFAAELLAPVDRIRASAPAGGVWTFAAQRAIAKELGVDQKVIGHQIENHGLGLAA